MKKAVTILLIFTTSIGLFSQTPLIWNGKVMTVNGLIPADSMGITLPHEHLLIVHKYNYLDLTNEADAITELGYYINAGGKTLAEASAIGIGRNPEGLKRISTATGANVIMSTGYYKDLWIHDTLKSKSIEQLTEIIINDIIHGINGIHAGFIKIGISRLITPFEEKVIIAAARAQVATGVAIDVHFDGHRATTDDRHHILDMFENEGVDLTRVYLSHCVPFVDLVDGFIFLAKRGCYLAFDMIGLEVRVDFEGELELTETLNALIDLGYIEQILISQDVCFSVCYVKNGGYGYAHILNNIVPQLKSSGITDAQIHTIMVENPKMVFPFKIYSNAGQCVNSTYTAITGTISDNSGTSDYHNNMSCTKLIQPSNSSSITLSFTAFDTESTMDVLSIYDGASTNSPLLGQFSGNMLPPILNSTGNSMLLVFNTNGSNTSSGWSANYYGKLNTGYSGPCVNEIFTAESGTITDNSGSSNYSAYMSCRKLIEVQGSTGIALQFTSFATQSGSDLVRVYNGASISSPLLGEFSGAALPPVLHSTGGSMLIEFNTDGSNEQAGWSANYTSNTLSVTPESRSVSSPAGSTTFTVSSNINWSVSEISGWLTATKTNGPNLTVSYAENTSVDPRSAEITVSGAGVSSQNIMVIQSGMSPALIVIPELRSVSPAQGTTTFTVTSNIEWSVSESSGWLIATKTHDTTLTVFYAENTSVDSRSAEITVSGAGVSTQIVMVNQSGVSPALIVLPELRSVSPAQGTTTFTVTSNIEWTLSESSDWLTATKTDDTTLTVNYVENTTVVSRSAEITVSGAGVGSQIVMLNQNGVNPALIVTRESRSVSSPSGTTTFTVLSNIEWSVNESSDWLTATKTHDTTLTVFYAENTSVYPRSAEITVIGAGVSTQIVMVNQSGVSPTLSITPEFRVISAASGITSFTVTSNIGWTTSDSSSWLVAAKADSITLLVGYEENTGLDFRSALITIKGADVINQSVTIMQESAILSTSKYISDIDNINIFPNPVSNRTWITNPKGTVLFIEIYDPSGRLINRIQNFDRNGTIEIDFTGLNSGIYIYHVIDKDGNIYNGKILKE